MYARYARIVCVSPPVADSLAAWAPRTRDRLTVIPTAVDVARFADAAPASKAAVLGVSEDTPVVLCVGRLEPVKDHATLIRALPEVPEVHAALVGDGPLRAELKELAHSLGIDNRVHFLGRRPDVPALLKMADIYAQPSRFEGWSIAVLEAMASGRAPLVVSRAPGLAEAVEGRGYLFPIGDAAALAATLQQALNDKTETARRVAAGREYANGFGIEQCVTAHLALYEEVLSVEC